MVDVNTTILQIGYWIALCLTQILILLIIKKIYKHIRNIGMVVIIIVCLGVVFSICVKNISNLPLIYMIMFIGEVLLFSLGFKLSMPQSYLCSCFYVFHAIVLKGIVVGIISLVTMQNSFQVLENISLKYLSIITVQMIMVCLFLFYWKKMNTKNIRTFLNSKKQLVLVLICHLTLTVFMLFNTFTFYYNLDLVWISISQILTGLILGILFIVILNYGISIADLLQHKLRNQSQLETIKYQLRKQNSILKIEKVLNLFKHDYREQMLEIEYQIDQNNLVAAKQEVRKNIIQQLNTLSQTKKYSNNIILNSLFIECQEQCDEKGIKLEVFLFLPPYLSIHEKECHEMFQILSKNAIEANAHVPKPHRFLKIKSEVEKNWVSIVVENAFQGSIHFEEGRPTSVKKKEENEGLGLLYIEEMISEINGIIQYKVDKEKGVFKVIVLLHVDEEEESMYER